ncbi:MarR family transcriptional regulator [Arthrobacter gandavensis]|uniref:MarR family winged helix-turn-helix transcriptional regulator n=1 Tax=Arthrobacter gandavensis TaxID=169960 RepID=UPI0018909315|nr:MarR family transcriptional regulator [Arthrobacter gandavensis]MBF4994935.1 MarR family transcriptional regulator [Arthrobacter gandavensis]
MKDQIEHILAQWAAERPDLDVSPMSVVGRISRVSRKLDARLAATFAAHGLDAAAFDVLATLRRSGAPYTLSPTELTASTMVTSAAIAQRLNRLEERGLISRTRNSSDGRGKRVALTTDGLALIDRALPDHLATEERILAGLSLQERDILAALLARIEATLDQA